MKKLVALVVVCLMLASPAWARTISDFHKRQRAAHSWATNTMPIASDFQVRIEYDGNDNPQYIGYAPKGSASSADVWIVYFLTYSGTNMTLKQTAYGSWDNRASLSYE